MPSVNIVTHSSIEIIIISHVHDQHTHAFTDLNLLPILTTVISRQFPIYQIPYLLSMGPISRYLNLAFYTMDPVRELGYSQNIGHARSSSS